MTDTARASLVGVPGQPATNAVTPKTAPAGSVAADLTDPKGRVVVVLVSSDRKMLTEIAHAKGQTLSLAVAFMVREEHKNLVARGKFGR